MLVLTRKKDESILIGEEIVLTVRSIRAEGVLFDVACPADVALEATGSDGSVAQADAGGAAANEAAGRTTRVEVSSDQALLIDRDIRLTIEGLYFTEGFPTRVRLGIQAPREIPILREELRRREGSR